MASGSNDLFDLKQDVYGLKNALDSINILLNDFKRQLDEINDIRQQVNSLKYSKDKDSALLEFLQQSHVSQTIFKNETTVNLSKCSADHKDLCVRFVNIINSFKDFSKVVEESAKDFDRRINETNSSVTVRLKSLEEKFDKKLDELKSQLVVHPKMILDQNEEIRAKVESAQLDGKNAVGKFSNLDTAIKLLERKMENLSIQQRKLELEIQMKE